jgi:SAM-dependent methyltransferase
VDCGGIDYVIGPEGRLAIPDDSFDMVLSTQVLEHVFQPQDYLKEAMRVLKPGGKLILTTHGVWEDHGCPYDFRRWTYDGLCRELEQAGFQVKKVARLTTGPRAIVFLFSQILGQLHDKRSSLSGLAFRLLRYSGFAIAELRNRWMDRQFSGHRVVFENRPGCGIYLALGIEGTKPQ